MEDEHVCVDNLIEHLGVRTPVIPAPGAFYGVSWFAFASKFWRLAVQYSAIYVLIMDQ
jgi:hypothetical protein